MAGKAVTPLSGVANSGQATAATHGNLYAHENESDAQLREIVDHALDGIVIIDDHGVITDINPAAQRLFGYSPKELIGQNVGI
ncbi:MAG: PAS domain S-box protein, partial [Rhodomicrobium sp.]